MKHIMECLNLKQNKLILGCVLIFLLFNINIFCEPKIKFSCYKNSRLNIIMKEKKNFKLKSYFAICPDKVERNIILNYDPMPIENIINDVCGSVEYLEFDIDFNIDEINILFCDIFFIEHLKYGYYIVYEKNDDNFLLLNGKHKKIINGRNRNIVFLEYNEIYIKENNTLIKYNFNFERAWQINIDNNSKLKYYKNYNSLILDDIKNNRIIIINNNTGEKIYDNNYLLNRIFEENIIILTKDLISIYNLKENNRIFQINVTNAEIEKSNYISYYKNIIYFGFEGKLYIFDCKGKKYKVEKDFPLFMTIDVNKNYLLSFSPISGKKNKYYLNMIFQNFKIESRFLGGRNYFLFKNKYTEYKILKSNYFIILYTNNEFNIFDRKTGFIKKFKRKFKSIDIKIFDILLIIYDKNNDDYFIIDKNKILNIKDIDKLYYR